MRALAVSRNPKTREWVRSALGPDWEVAEASNAIEALRALADEWADVVIANQTTEPYGAFGLAHDLKMEKDPPAVIVLLDRAQDNWLAKWSGADAWLVHPVDPFELAATARELEGALEVEEPAGEEPS